MTDHHPRSFARYKPDISLGNILSVIGMSVAVIVWGLRLEGRVTSNEQIAVLQQQNVELRIQHVENRIDQQKQDFGQVVGEVKDALTRIETKLDGKADKVR